MPLKAMKRKASSQSSGVAKQCRTLLSTIRSADNVPQPVRAMICDSLTRTFGTYKESRHPLQASVSALVGKIVNDAQSKLQGAINDAQGKKAAVESEAAALITANDAAVAASEAASQALTDAKAAVADGKKACRDAKAALHDLEAAAKNAAAETKEATAKKASFDALVTDVINHIKAGEKSPEGRSVGKLMAPFLEPEFLVHVNHTYSKAGSAWGTFDNLVNKRLEDTLHKVLGDLTSDLAARASAAEASAAQINAAHAAVAAAEEHSKTTEAAIEGATTAAKDADAAAKAAAAALKPHQGNINKAAQAVTHAEEALADFTKGPLAAYTAAESHTAPPEPVAAAESAGIEGAMQPAPAPAARAAPTVLPSPGVLSWVAQKSGLARSPEVANTPQVQQSPGR